MCDWIFGIPFGRAHPSVGHFSLPRGPSGRSFRQHGLGREEDGLRGVLDQAVEIDTAAIGGWSSCPFPIHAHLGAKSGALRPQSQNCHTPRSLAGVPITTINFGRSSRLLSIFKRVCACVAMSQSERRARLHTYLEDLIRQTPLLVDTLTRMLSKKSHKLFDGRAGPAAHTPSTRIWQAGD